ncbi:MAG TPA: co-chaperone DjlA [Candidatus Saccharimonadia bacterium]|nr:co-chaperone DjlA [Candidatus Saccharimonadia bacterium]
MRIWGKLLGLIVGWLMFRHPVGAAIGFALGHAWDEGWLTGQLAPPVGAGEFVEPLFGLAGSVAKANGRVSQAEIGATERLMQRMALDEAQRLRAIASFNLGKVDDYDVDAAAQEMRAWCVRRGDQRLIVLEVLAEIGAADGELAAAAEARLARIALVLGISGHALDWVLRRYRGRTAGAGGSAGAQGGSRPHARTIGPDPYAALGIPSTASEGDIRRAYRRLMSQHHPDKLQSRGASPEMIRVAEERAREINAAYEQLRSLRGFS